MKPKKSKPKAYTNKNLLPIVLKLFITIITIPLASSQNDNNNNNYYTYNTPSNLPSSSPSPPWILLSSPLSPTTPPPASLLNSISTTDTNAQGFNWVINECSRPCGGGVKKLEYKCERGCPGETTQATPSIGPFYTSCNTHPCPDTQTGPGRQTSSSFRSLQCSHFDSVLFEGRYYSWVPYTKSTDKCELNCMPKGERFYYRHRKRVVDGTECDEEKGTSGGICVEGVCVPLGCDLLLGSSTREDSCRECGGNNLNCNTVTGVFNDPNLQVGYNDVLLIPKGATNVEIKEIEPSNNYLALRNLSSHFYLNGNWRIDFPRELNFAGTTWHYERKQPGFYSPESVKALGPTTEGIYVVLLYQEPLTSGLSYTYSVPKDSVSITSSATYYWAAGDWTQCSVTCGRGLKRRNVRCLSRETGREVNRELCGRDQNEPRGEEWCGGEREMCPVSWSTTAWSHCNASCNSVGVQYRHVYCSQVNDGVTNILDDGYCSGPRPEEFQRCRGPEVCPEWWIGEWSECPSLCGSSSLTRQVLCYLNTSSEIQLYPDNLCPSPKPPSSTPCSAPFPCTGLDWFESPWQGCTECGQETERRTVFCGDKEGVKSENEDLCDNARKPEIERKCDEIIGGEKCNYNWWAKEWGECSSPCTPGGLQSRQVFCGETKADGSIVKVNESNCDLEKKYNETKECEFNDMNPKPNCTQGQWWSGPWGRCTKCSPKGQKSRPILCILGNVTVEVSKCGQDGIPESLMDCEDCEEEEGLGSGSSTTQSPEIVVDYDEVECEEIEVEEEDEEEGEELGSGAKSEDIEFGSGEGIGATTMIAIAVGELEDGSGDADADNNSSSGSGAIVDLDSDELGSGSGDSSTLISTRRRRKRENEDSDYEELDEDENDDSADLELIENNSTTTTIDPELENSTTTTTSPLYDDLDYDNFTGSGITAEGTVVGEEEEEDIGGGNFTSTSTTEISTTTSYGEIETSTTSVAYSSTTTTTTGSTESTTATTTGSTESTTATISTESTTESGDLTTTQQPQSTTEGDLTTTQQPQSTTEGDFISTTTIATLDLSTTTILDAESTTTLSPDDDDIDEDSENVTTTTTSSENTTLTTLPTTTESLFSSTTLLSLLEDDSNDTSTTEQSSTPPADSLSTTTIFPPQTETTTQQPQSTDFTTTTELLGSTSTTSEPPFILTKTVCKPKHERKINCSGTQFGCCPNGKDRAKGTFWEGCPLPTTCSSTLYGCCHDNITTASGPNYYGCKSKCSSTIFGCCPDGFTVKTDSNGDLCPSPCDVSKYGCCNGTLVQSPGPNQRGCQDVIPCELTKWGCCPKGEVRAKGKDYKGCPEIDLKNCNNSWFGCCSDNKTAALSPYYTNCPPPCTYSLHGCCPNDTTTTPHGPNFEGCCINTEFGCCQDNVQPAQGPNYLNCSCETSPYGCCPDNETFASSSGCGCKFSEGGCCEDGWTEKVVSGNETGMGDGEGSAEMLDEGCPCYSFKFGCCPDGVRRAKGRNFEGCGCEYTSNGCCPDGRTPKPSDGSDCTCEASLYGCCPDGSTPATGEDFQGCEVKPIKPGDICHLERQRGPCRNFTVKWFFDMEYGGCSRYWYGGCEGNDNRFNTQDECKGVCVEPEGRDSCYLPLVPGPCEGYYPSYYYSPLHSRCLQFVYRGCLGNNNRFQTIEECENKCSTESHVNPCNQPKVEGPCGGNYTKYYFDQAANECSEFTYGGCKGGSNAFGTKRECEWRCKDQLGGQIGSIEAVRAPKNQPMDSIDDENVQYTTTDLNLIAPAATCLYPVTPGHCTLKLSNWYYDRSSSRCLPFYYTGCGGNNNRFESREECERSCPAELLKEYYDPSPQQPQQPEEPSYDPREYRLQTCSLPPTTGSCGDYVERYYFDIYSSQCKPFIYSGCDGNNNNFETVFECENLCGRPRRQETEEIGGGGSDLFDFKAEFCFQPMVECGERNYGVGPVWGYDSSEGVCKEYFGAGCTERETRNRFNSRDECEVRCDGVQDPCTLPPLKGPCSSSFSQYYYDPDSDTCTLFSYSGCQGNANRFDNLQLCESRCKRGGETTTLLTGQSDPRPPTENEVSLDACGDPQDPGPCRARIPMYYYNSYSQRCEMFIYGGCGGNGNKFGGVEECEERCVKGRGSGQQTIGEEPCPPSNCDNSDLQAQCQYGLSRHYLREGSSCIVCDCFEPCAHVRCSSGQECGVSRDETDGRFKGECRDATKPGTCPGYDYFQSHTTCPDPANSPPCSTDSLCPGPMKCCYSPPCTSYICQLPQIPPPQITSDPRDQVLEIPEGGLGKFRCKLVGGAINLGNRDFKWSINGENVDENKNRKRARVVVLEFEEERDEDEDNNDDSFSTLEIVGVRGEDNGVEIKCWVENSSGAKAERTWQLRVGAPLPPSTATLLPLPHSLPPATLGSPYTLHCYALGYPHPQITWWRENKMLPTTSEKFTYNKTDPELLIRIVQIRDLGPYTCQAYNGEGRAPSQTMELIAWDEVEENVVIEQSERDTFGQWLVPKRGSATSSTGQQKYRPEYRPPGPQQGLEIVTESAIISTQEQTTILPPIEKQQHVEYEVPLTSSISPPYRTYPSGSTLSLTCQIQGYPEPDSIIWYKSDRRLSYGSTLTINSVTPQDSGSYICVASNSVNSRTESRIDIFIQPEVNIHEEELTTEIPQPQSPNIPPPSSALHPNCTDNAFFAKCDLIVKARYCNNKYYARFCCKSCTVDGQLPVAGEHLRGAGEKWFQGVNVRGKETNVEVDYQRNQEMRQQRAEQHQHQSSNINSNHNNRFNWDNVNVNNNYV